MSMSVVFTKIIMMHTLNHLGDSRQIMFSSNMTHLICM